MHAIFGGKGGGWGRWESLCEIEVDDGLQELDGFVVGTISHIGIFWGNGVRKIMEDASLLGV